MRQIGTIARELDARRFCDYLAGQQIESSIDASFDPQTGQASYAIWVHNEDQLAVASISLEKFLKNPFDPAFDAPISQQIPPDEPPAQPIIAERPRIFARATYCLIALCALLFFFNAIQELTLREKGFSEEDFLITPLQSEFLYDVPPALGQLENAVQTYNPPEGQRPKGVPPEIRAELDVFHKTPFFQGVYSWVLSEPVSGPIFYKIGQGEIWRLFTPCLLHAGLLHIAFNMIWLWVLGKQIEQRIGWMRYVLLTIVIGIFGNTVQYLISGPFFLGYSGIITGLAGFIWSRERIAPWEGYPLQKSMLWFLGLFILAMFILQLVSLILLLFTSVRFAPNIANAAHIAGALLGILLGRLSFFDVRGALR